jgi:hypothetical protein
MVEHQWVLKDFSNNFSIAEEIIFPLHLPTKRCSSPEDQQDALEQPLKKLLRHQPRSKIPGKRAWTLLSSLQANL